jgi:hypothetical protein
METNGDSYTPIPGMRHSTHSGNPDFNSRKVTGQRTTTTSIRLGKSCICDEAYRDWYENTHPQPHSLDQAIEYWINRRRQLKRCQANPPLSYEVFLHANQPAEGHPANDTWDYGQLYRLHMIRAQAAQDISRWDITEEDVDNYLIRIALSDRQHDIDATSTQSTDQRGAPLGK